MQPLQAWFRSRTSVRAISCSLGRTRIQTRGIVVDANKKVGIGTTSPNANSRLTVNANGQQQAIHASSGATGWPTFFGFNGNVLGEVFRADGIADVTASSGGVIVVGQDNDYNLGIDRNEIMARFNGAPSDLFLNLEGGNTEVGGRLGVGVNTGFGQLRIKDTDPGAAFGLEIETSQQSTLPSIFAENLASGPVLWAKSDGNDVSLSGGGIIMTGVENGQNIAIDTNEIMARNNGQAAPLHLNLEGGDVVIGGHVIMGPHAIKPAYAYGKIAGDGQIISASTSVTSVFRTSEGRYTINIAGIATQHDIVVVSTNWSLRNASAGVEGSSYKVYIEGMATLNPIDSEFNFIIYHP